MWMSQLMDTKNIQSTIFVLSRNKYFYNNYRKFMMQSIETN